MRWTNKPSPMPGDKRTRTFFALWPVSVGCPTPNGECRWYRWLERVTVRETRFVDFLDVERWRVDSFVDPTSPP